MPRSSVSTRGDPPMGCSCSLYRSATTDTAATGRPESSVTRPVITPPAPKAKSIPSRMSPLETVTMKPAKPTPDDIITPAFSNSGTRRTTRAGAKGFTTYRPSGTPGMRYFPSSSVIALGRGDFVLDKSYGSKKTATNRAGFPPFVIRPLMTPVGAEAAPDET
jgi:hypothetical protein